jgi:hypothetical protein
MSLNFLSWIFNGHAEKEGAEEVIGRLKGNERRLDLRQGGPSQEREIN